MPASSTTAEITPDVAPERALPAVGRSEAVRQLSEAQRLYDVATLVHERRTLGGIDSAPLAHRALTLLLQLLVRLHGEAPPEDGYAALVERARAIFVSESLFVEDLTADLALLAEMRERFLEPSSALTPADDRRYDRAFVRVSELFAAVRAYLNERLPAEVSGLRKYWKTALAIAAAFFVGLLVGMRLHPPAPPPPLAAATPVGAAAPAGPGFSAIFYRDMEHRDVAFTRVDRSISFDWGADAPSGLENADHFSARWEGRLNIEQPGAYVFYLTSDDGSRLMIDGKNVVDNWGNHAEVTRESEIKLEKGLHQLRVEYFEAVGGASIKLEWSSERFARRLVAADDLR